VQRSAVDNGLEAACCTGDSWAEYSHGVASNTDSGPKRPITSITGTVEERESLVSDAPRPSTVWILADGHTGALDTAHSLIGGYSRLPSQRFRGP